ALSKRRTDYRGLLGARCMCCPAGASIMGLCILALVYYTLGASNLLRTRQAMSIQVKQAFDSYIAASPPGTRKQLILALGSPSQVREVESPEQVGCRNQFVGSVSVEEWSYKCRDGSLKVVLLFVGDDIMSWSIADA